ncbi:unnamed protein product [Phytophthora lilii]|uniref:Unnamed protein product n=1 Tax=Phytophthora lilii TaxID=2077276 RepID=A0A9W6X376_9STRA|nr:unnamed protein product [Phytophthora lilii]
MLEKLPSGGILVHVRTAEAESHFVGQEVNLLGNKFKLKRQSILARKFFLDVSGIYSSNEADTLAVALSAKDVNIKMKIATPTWRFTSDLQQHPHTWWFTNIADDDTDMLVYAIDAPEHCAAGFKHGEFELADKNPYSPLESEECDFDVFQPETTPELPEAVVMVPHLHKKERPKKKGPGSSPADRDRDEAVLEEALLQSHEEALLMIKPDHVKANIEHYHASETLFHKPRNMDQIVQAILSCPLSWSMVFLQELKHGGDALLDLGTLHLWDRVLASESMDDDNNIHSFYQRINDVNLPIGNTRADYVKFLKLTFRQLSSEDKNAWNLLRYFSLLELLTLSFCLSTSRLAAIHCGNTDEGLPHKHVKLLSDKSL